MTEDKIDGRVTGTLEGWYYDAVHNVVWGSIDYDIKGRFYDGAHIHTSDIPKFRQDRVCTAKQGDLIYTRNSIYRLGKPLSSKRIKQSEGIDVA